MRQPVIDRRRFLAGVGIAGVSAAGAGLAGCSPRSAGETAADGTEASTSAANEEGAAYRSIAEQLNPQDYDYRQNSGDLSHVLSPWKLGNLEFQSRIAKSAAGSNYMFGGWDAFAEYYRRIAAGGTEMIWVETFAHIYQPYTHKRFPNIDEYDDDQVRAFVDALHAEGAKVGTQTDIMSSAFLTELQSRGAMDAALFSTDEIEYMLDCFRHAAEKYKAWGFDAWELNCAGNNQTQWFFSRSRNHRDDEYGAQSFENRTRFIGRVIQVIKETCGEDFPIQILMDSINENDKNLGMNYEFNTLEDNIEIAKQLEKLGVSSLHVRLGPQENHGGQFLGDLYFDTRGCIGTTSFGGQFDFSRHFQGKVIANHSGCGLMLDIAAEFKKAVSIPVGTVTYLDPAHAPDFIDQAIADGKIDWMQINRPITCDNEYVRKLKEGRLDEIRPCMRCCTCINDLPRGELFDASKPGSEYQCRLDPIRDMVGQDVGMPGWFDPEPGDGEKNVMVVGGGPGGMEAARIAAERGYAVTLYEEDESLGGLMTFAEAIKGPHQNMSDYITWSKGDLERKGVTIVTGQQVDASFIKEQAPDVCIIAVGGKRPELALTGDEATTVISADDVVNVEIGQHVTIVGENCQALDICMYLLEQGKQVTIVTDQVAGELGKGQSLWSRKFTIPMVYTRGVRLWQEAELTNAAGGEATVLTNTGVEVTYPCDTVIAAMDMLPNEDLLKELDGIEAYAVGDCTDPYNIEFAVRSGNYTARTI